MSEEIRVTVVSVGQGRPLSLRWIDPATGRPKFKSAKTRKRKKAERAAAALERDLREGEAGDECPDGLARLHRQVW